MAPHASTWHRHYEKAWGRVKKKVNKNILFFSLSYKHKVRYLSLEFGDKDPKPNFRIEKVYKIKPFN